MRTLCLIALQLLLVMQAFPASIDTDGVVKILIYPEELVQPQEDEALLARGSGFLVSQDGIVFTNSDVVEWCLQGYMIVDWQDPDGLLEKEVILTFQEDYEKNPKIKKVYRLGHATPLIQVFNGHTSTLYTAEVVAMGVSYKGAALKILSKFGLENSTLPPFSPLKIGNSHHLVHNETITFLGFPDKADDFGADLNQTVQTVHGKSLQERAHLHFHTFQTNTKLNEGFSGGPALDSEYKVIGLIATPSQVLPINLMCEVLKMESDILNQLEKIGLCRPIKSVHLNTVPREIN